MVIQARTEIKRVLRAGVCGVLVLLIFAASACAAPPSADEVRGTLVGIGDGAQKDTVYAWAQGWKSARRATAVAFSPDGNGVGLSALNSNQSYFAATSGVPEAGAAAQCGPSGALTFPTDVLPVVVGYNLPGIDGLRLDADTLGAILEGRVSAWNDARVVALNPMAKLPGTKITVHLSRGEASVARAVNDYLGYSAPAASSGPRTEAWRTSTVGLSDDDPIRVADSVEKEVGSITVLRRSTVGSRFATAKLKFGAAFAPATDADVVQAIADSSAAVSPDGSSVTMALSDQTGYSLAITGYQVLCRTYQEPVVARLVRDWGEYVLSAEGQQTASRRSGALAPSEAATAASLKVVSTIKGVHE